MTRKRLVHFSVAAALLVVFVVVLALPADAAYTKLYRVKNTTGINQASLRATNNALEMIVGYTATPTAWKPPAISNVLRSGVWCTQLMFGGLGTPYVAPNAYGYIGWRTADSGCRLCDMRWRAPNGTLYPVTSATQTAGVPGGGEVQYINGQYVWTLINDTGAPIDLSNVSLAVLDAVPPTVDELIGKVWPEVSGGAQGQTRTMQGKYLSQSDTAQLSPPAAPLPPPRPRSGAPANEYVHQSWDAIHSRPKPQLPADSYTAFVVPDDDGVANESLLLTTAVGDELVCVELYTPGGGGAGAD